MRNVAETHVDMEIMRKKSGTERGGCIMYRMDERVKRDQNGKEGDEVSSVRSHHTLADIALMSGPSEEQWVHWPACTYTHMHTRGTDLLYVYTPVLRSPLCTGRGKKRQTHTETLHDIMKIRTDWCGRFMLVFIRFVHFCASKKRRQRLLTINNPSSVKIKSQEMSICLSTHPHARDRARSRATQAL